MELLEEFTGKDFIEQVTILQEIENRKCQEALPDLIHLSSTLSLDGSLSYMLENALRAVLSENEAETVKLLESDNARLKRLCIQLCGQYRFASAGPVLTELLEKTPEPDLLFDMLSALSQIKLPEFLPVFKHHMLHPVPTISALCIEMIGSYADTSSVPALSAMVETAERDDRFKECELSTAKAIEALGSIGDDSAVSALCSKIHHRNPKARQIIHEQLLNIGLKPLPYLAAYFDDGDIDHKIMAANILGDMGVKAAGDILVDAMDKGAVTHPNIKFAVYEAFGKIFFMKGLICLIDGLKDEDETVLMAVVSSLDRQINPGVVKKIRETVCTPGAQSERLKKAIVSAKAVSIFEFLYDDPAVASSLVAYICASNDQEIISAFAEKLSAITGERAEADARKLAGFTVSKTGKRILAIDDSAPILLFYRSIASDMGIDIVTAGNGKEALELLEQDPEVDLILTDMNMPVMDGIEFTREARLNPFVAHIPIVMVTTESESSQVQLAKHAGVTDFLKKPFTADTLKTSISGLMP